MKELREKSVSARIKPSARRIIENSKYSYADAIEYFAFNKVNNEDKLMRLKHLKVETSRIERQMQLNQLEIDLISKELDINPDDDEIFAEDIKKNIKAVINWFNRTHIERLEDFFIIKESKIKPYAIECHLEYDEFKERVIKKYNSRKEDKSDE